MCVEHTKEPWVAVKDGNPELRNEAWHIEGRDGDLVTYGHITEGDVRRVVACVNACAGIPTKELEAAVSGKPRGAGLMQQWQNYHEAQRQRDEAVARCERLERELDRANGFHERLAEKRDKLLDALKRSNEFIGYMLDHTPEDKRDNTIFVDNRSIIAEAEAR